MRLVILLAMLFVVATTQGQSTVYLRADTIKVMKQNGNATLTIENATKDSTNGVLLNYLGGRTRFERIRAINDSQFTVGTDTIEITGGLGTVNNIYTNDGTLTGNRSVTMGSYSLGFEKDIYIYGIRAGRGPTTFNANTIFGMNASAGMTTGNANSLFGRDAGRYITDGYSNTYMGWLAGGGNTQTGYQNAGFGGQALWQVSSGRDNSALGFQTLYGLTTGIRNQAQGTLALGLLTIGNDNIGIGELAGHGVVKGNSNVFVGAYAGQDTYGTQRASTGNVFLGNSAGYQDTASNKLIIANNASENLVVGDFSADSIRFNGGVSIRDVIEANGSTRVLVWDSANQHVGYRYLSNISGGGGGGGPIPINDLLAADGTNTIDNANYLQDWEWNSLLTTGLELSSSSTLATGTNSILNVARSGVNANSGVTSYAILAGISNTGTNAINTALYGNASAGSYTRGAVGTATGTIEAIGVTGVGVGATTTYGGHFTATSGTTNIALYTGAGDVQFDVLSGSGDRMVVADATGVLSTQAIPSGGSSTRFGVSGEDATAAQTRSFSVAGNDFRIEDLAWSSNLFRLRNRTATNQNTLNFDGSSIEMKSVDYPDEYQDARVSTAVSGGNPVIDLWSMNTLTSKNNRIKLTDDSLHFSGAGQNLTWRIYNLPSATASNVLYYDPSTRVVTHGTAPSGSGVNINDLLLADGTNNIDNANYNQTWSWNSLTGATASGLKLTSSSTAGTASNYSSVLELQRTGANANSSVQTNGLRSWVTNTGTSSQNVGGHFVASGGTFNYGILSEGTTYGVFGTSAGGHGVWGVTTSGDFMSGVYGQNTLTTGTGYGVRGDAQGAKSVGYGVFGTSNNATTNYGVYGSGSTYGVYGTGNSYAIYGSSTADGAQVIRANHNGAGGTTAYGMYSNLTGANTNNYGLYVNVTTATNQYAIVTSSGRSGFGTITPSDKAIVEMASTTQGFLLPRMTKAQRDAITSPPAGLMVYQTDNTPGLRVYNGTNWMRYTETAD
jgi:hypothetical protein